MKSFTGKIEYYPNCPGQGGKLGALFACALRECPELLKTSPATIFPEIIVVREIPPPHGRVPQVVTISTRWMNGKLNEVQE